MILILAALLIRNWLKAPYSNGKLHFECIHMFILYSILVGHLLIKSIAVSSPLKL